MSWTPLYVPLVAGLDLSNEISLGGQGLHVALNVDYAVAGAIKGRPSRAAAKQFVVRDPATNFGGMTPGYLAAQSFTASGFTPRGIVRLRDGLSERAGLACDGRLFSQDGTRWIDRGHFACARVDRQINHHTDYVGRMAIAPDFGFLRTNGTTGRVYALTATTGVIEREKGLTAGIAGYDGNGARCGTTTAIVVRAISSDNLYLVYRSASGDTLTEALLATDAASWTDTGDAPAICSSRDAATFWVAYRTTTANVFKVLRVSITGTVVATYTSAAIAGLHGLWIDNTTVATDRLLVGITHGSGLTLRTLVGTTMADVGVDSTYVEGTTDGKDVVVGLQSDTVAWFCYRSHDSATSGNGNLVLGTCTVGTAASAVAVKTYIGGLALNDAYLTWGICHQPVRVNGRMYITLMASSGGSDAASWVTLDLTNLWSTGGATGPFPQPSLVAQGPAQGTKICFQPGNAVPLSDDTGWTFPTQDWLHLELEADQGLDGVLAGNGLNKVTFSQPRTAQAGRSTVFSGSVPHIVGFGDCVEMGFPFLGGIPGITAADTSGGVVQEGTYGVQALWRWTDSSGQVQRSAASAISTATITLPSNAILAVVSNPWLTEKNSRDIFIELYVTDKNPTADAPHFLQSSTPISLANAWTAITLLTQPVLTGDPIYTDGSVLAAYPVRADGGLTVSGRRLFMASANTVYASKYLEPGLAPEFNDEGTHQVNLPPGAGRIISLETIEDKVVVFCERGIYYVYGDGPDNTGAGPDFASPARISDLSIAGPRASCSLGNQRVVFCTTLDSTDPTRGGPWLLGQDATEPKYMGRAVIDKYLRSSSWVPEVAYSTEKEQVYITTNVANGVSHGVVMFDMRDGKWSVWDLNSTSHGALRFITTVSGILWTLQTEPAPFDGTPGTDSGGGAYPMTVATAHMAADGQSGLGWSRVRAVSVLGAAGTGDYTLTPYVLLDGTRPLTGDAVAMTTPTLVAGNYWPGTRQASEWRLPVQKCSTIQIQLTASPATARWAAIRFDVAPLPSRAPTAQRS